MTILIMMVIRTSTWLIHACTDACTVNGCLCYGGTGFCSIDSAFHLWICVCVLFAFMVYRMSSRVSNGQLYELHLQWHVCQYADVYAHIGDDLDLPPITIASMATTGRYRKALRRFLLTMRDNKPCQNKDARVAVPCHVVLLCVNALLWVYDVMLVD